MRNLVHVIDRILVEIPAWDHSGLSGNLTWLKGEVDYTAPELMPNLWRFGTLFIDRVIPRPPVSDWEWKVVALWMDKSIIEIEGMFNAEDTKTNPEV
jgi:hypothetical protein